MAVQIMGFLNFSIQILCSMNNMKTLLLKKISYKITEENHYINNPMFFSSVTQPNKGDGCALYATNGENAQMYIPSNSRNILLLLFVFFRLSELLKLRT